MTPEALAALQARAYVHMRPWSTGDFAALLQQRHTHLIAVDRGFLLGRIVADEAEILALAIDPDVQRTGLARDCLSRFINVARTKGANRIFLDVSEANAPALAFYTNAGFGIVGRRRDYYRGPDGACSDALVMARHIDPATNRNPG